jgi:hypothetical protein
MEDDIQYLIIFHANVYSILDFLRLRADPSSIRDFDFLILQSFVL